MTALQWLNDLVQWLGRLFPRLTLVPPTHSGVLFGPMGGASDKGKGVVLWWPLLQKLVKIPTTTQSVHVCARAMPGQNDNKLIPRICVCGLAVQYRVVDPAKAAVKVLNLHALVDNRCQAAPGHHWTKIDAAVGAIASVKEDVEDCLEEFGVQVDRLDITHLGEAVGVLQLGDFSWSDDGSGTARDED